VPRTPVAVDQWMMLTWHDECWMNQSGMAGKLHALLAHTCWGWYTLSRLESQQRHIGWPAAATPGHNTQP